MPIPASGWWIWGPICYPISIEDIGYITLISNIYPDIRHQISTQYQHLPMSLAFGCRLLFLYIYIYIYIYFTILIFSFFSTIGSDFHNMCHLTISFRVPLDLSSVIPSNICCPTDIRLIYDIKYFPPYTPISDIGCLDIRYGTDISWATTKSVR